MFFFHQVECAKFPEKKSFVVASILLRPAGGVMALCMEDPDVWGAARQDYPDQCQVWLCTLPTLTVVHPLEVVSPGCVSLLCRAINSLQKGGNRHVASFHLPKETKQLLFPVSKVGSGLRSGTAAPSGIASGTLRAVRTSGRVKQSKKPLEVQAPEKAKATPKATPRKPKHVTPKAPVTAKPLPSNTKGATPLRPPASGAASRGVAHEQEEPEQQEKVEDPKVQALEKQVRLLET